MQCNRGVMICIHLQPPVGWSTQKWRNFHLLASRAPATLLPIVFMHLYSCIIEKYSMCNGKNIFIITRIREKRFKAFPKRRSFASLASPSGLLRFFHRCTAYRQSPWADIICSKNKYTKHVILFAQALDFQVFGMFSHNLSHIIRCRFIISFFSHKVRKSLAF